MQGLARYYEAMALDQSGAGSKALLKSSEGFNLYAEALGKSGRLGEIATAVRRRDSLLASLNSSTSGVQPISSPTANANLPSSLPDLTSLASATQTTASSAQPPATPIDTAPQQSPSASPLSALNTAGQAGTPLSPIHVQLAPATPQTNAWRAVRWVAGMVLWMFVLLTVLGMVMENTGLLKAGPGPMEFEPEEGKVVKFSDVHGVEEAKSVGSTSLDHFTP